jgi:hypothetical protein
MNGITQYGELLIDQNLVGEGVFDDQDSDVHPPRNSAGLTGLASHESSMSVELLKLESALIVITFVFFGRESVLINRASFSRQMLEQK